MPSHIGLPIRFSTDDSLVVSEGNETDICIEHLGMLTRKVAVFLTIIHFSASGKISIDQKLLSIY